MDGHSTGFFTYVIGVTGAFISQVSADNVLIGLSIIAVCIRIGMDVRAYLKDR